MLRRWTGALTSLVVLGGVLFGCAPARESAAPASAPAAAGVTGAGTMAGAAAPSPGAADQPLQRIEVPITSTSSTMVPLWVAADHGLWAKHGLDVSLVAVPPSTGSQALIAGSVPVGAIGGSILGAWVNGAPDVVFVAGLSNATPYKIAARPEIGSLLDLRGKSVATTTPGATTSVVLGEVLRRLGMEPDRDVSIAYVRDSPGMVAAVVSNNSQAAILSSPFVEQILAEGGKILLDVRELNVPILGINITTTRGQIERDPELIRRFLRGYIEGIQLAREDAEIGMQSLMKATQNTDRAVAAASYAEYRDIWNPWPSEAGIQILLDAMEEPAARSAKPADAIDLRFLQELERSGWLAEHYRPN